MRQVWRQRLGPVRTDTSKLEMCLNKRHITTLILTEDQEVWVPAKLPSTATLHWKSEPSPSKLDFENQQSLHSGELEGYRKHILHSEYTQNLTCSDSQHRGSHLKGTWVRLYLLNLKSIWKRQEVAEIKILVVDLFGISFYRANNDILESSLTLLMRGHAIPTSRACSSCASPESTSSHKGSRSCPPLGLQWPHKAVFSASQAGSQPQNQDAQSSKSWHNRRALTAHTGNTLDHLALMASKKYAARPHKMPPI